MTTPLTDTECAAVQTWWLTGSVKETAIKLDLAESTVKNALNLARRKTGTPNTLMLAKWHVSTHVCFGRAHTLFGQDPQSNSRRARK